MTPPDLPAAQRAELARYLTGRLTMLRRQADSLDHPALREALRCVVAALDTFTTETDPKAAIRLAAHLEHLVRTLRQGTSGYSPVVLYLRGANLYQANTDRCTAAAHRLGLRIVRTQRGSTLTGPATTGYDPALTGIFRDLAAQRIAGILTYAGMLADWPAWREAFAAAGGRIHTLNQPSRPATAALTLA